MNYEKLLEWLKDNQGTLNITPLIDIIKVSIICNSSLVKEMNFNYSYFTLNTVECLELILNSTFMYSSAQG
jgi:hypothetical protein